jgi:3-oxoacyl-[acyl-carrier protein] reductase
MSLENEIALVTGASRGIGKAIALTLGKEGAVVIGTATSQTGADAISAELEANNIKGKGYVLDVTEQSSIDSMLSAVQNEFGAPSVLVNNAGITKDNLLMRMKDEEWESIINTNLTSIYRLSKACLRDMMKQRKGRIINISSVVGVAGNAGQTNYAAA